MPYIINDKGERIEMYTPRPPPRVEHFVKENMPSESDVLKGREKRLHPAELQEKFEETDYEEQEEDEDRYYDRRRGGCGSGHMWLILILALLAIGLGVLLMRKYGSSSSSSTTAEVSSNKVGLRFY